MKDEDWFNEIEERYDSLEKYLSFMMNVEAIPLLKGHKPFEYLLEKGLLQEGMSVRTNNGRVDHHYEITKESKLEGVQAPVHGGPEGIHNPLEKLFSCNFWTIESTNTLRFLLRQKESS